MHYLITLSLLLTMPISGFAKTTTCILDADSPNKIIAWNDETRNAEVTNLLGKIRPGKVTRATPHLSGMKVNIYVTYENLGINEDFAEYIIFPTLTGDYRVVGVGYKVEEGKRYLNSSQGNSAANCSSREM